MQIIHHPFRAIAAAEARRPILSRKRSGPSGARRVLLALGLAIGFWSALPGVLAAQYTPPGSPTPGEDIPPQETLEEAIAQARWRFGGVRLTPWLGLRDVQFVSNVSDRPGAEGDNDFTATLGAGLRAYVRTGGKVIWTAHALPEYAFWQDTEAKRRLNGRFGLGVFAYFNRLTLEASQRRVETQNFFTPELLQLTTTRQDISRLAVELALSRSLRLYAAGIRQESINQEEDTPLFAALDRDIETLRIGLRFEASRHWFAGIGFEDVATDFTEGARRLSNQGTAETFDLGFTGNRFNAQLQLAFRELEPEGIGSQFRAFDETTGSLDVLWQVRQRVSLLTYGRRHIYYPLSADSSSVTSDRYGARLEISGSRVLLAWIAELGEDAFNPILEGSALPRLDDVSAAGVELSLMMRRLLRVGAHVVRTRYDSNDDLFDRDFTVVGITVELGRLLERLRLGYQGGVW